MSDILRALDLPPELLSVQDAFWQAEREWEELHKAYRLVVADVLKRREESVLAFSSRPPGKAAQS